MDKIKEYWGVVKPYLGKAAWLGVGVVIGAVLF